MGTQRHQMPQQGVGFNPQQLPLYPNQHPGNPNNQQQMKHRMQVQQQGVMMFPPPHPPQQHHQQQHNNGSPHMSPHMSPHHSPHQQQFSPPLPPNSGSAPSSPIAQLQGPGPSQGMGGSLLLSSPPRENAKMLGDGLGNMIVSPNESPRDGNFYGGQGLHVVSPDGHGAAGRGFLAPQHGNHHPNFQQQHNKQQIMFMQQQQQQQQQARQHGMQQQYQQQPGMYQPQQAMYAQGTNGGGPSGGGFGCF
jgi:hypothetical protein